jgi:hypothetical protein
MASNNESHQIAVNALIRMRKDLMFEIGQDERALQAKRDSVFHLEKSILAMDPKQKLERLPIRNRRPTKSIHLYHGEITERVMDTLRDANDHSTSSDQVAQAAMRDKGMNPVTDSVVLKDLEKRIRLQFNALRREGIVEKVDGRGPSARWLLTEKAGGND